MHLYVHWCVCVCGGGWCLPQCHPYPLRHGLSLACSPIRLDWLASEPWEGGGSPAFASPMLRWQVCTTMHDFTWALEGQNSEPYAFETNTNQVSYAYRPLESCFYSCFFISLFFIIFIYVYLCVHAQPCACISRHKIPWNWSSRQL